MNLYRYLLDGKEESCSAALLASGKTYSYKDLASAATFISDILLQHGGKRGDRALLMAESGFFWVAAYLGTLRAGLTCVPLSLRSSKEDVRYVCEAAEARFAFLGSLAIDTIGPLLQGLIIVRERPVQSGSFAIDDLDALRQRSGKRPESATEVHANDMAALMFTSGSTGTPRGVMVSVGNIVANTDSIVESLSLSIADRIMAVLPFHYCFGTSLLHSHLRVGGSIVVEPRFLYADAVLKRMQQTQCTGFAGVPSHYQILLRRSSIGAMKFPHLRYVQQAGGHLARSFIQDLQRALPGIQIYIMYGQTEATARLSCLPPEFLDRKMGSVGRAIPGVNLRIVDEAGRPVSPGQAGEIVAEGANVTLGYWRDPDETAKRFRKGKLYTGDLATIDEDGFIYIVDRISEFVKCGGQRVSCRHIEDLLLESRTLVEAAAIGIPDPILGEAVKVFVVPRERSPKGCVDELMRICRSRLPPPLVPKQITIVDALPKNASGKVQRSAMRQSHNVHS